MFPDLVQRDVEILGGRPVQAQCDFGFHPTTLLTCRKALAAERHGALLGWTHARADVRMYGLGAV
jgi:hypothetical protein